MTSSDGSPLAPGFGSGSPERETPGPGQESVWDYPRPPRVEPVRDRLRVVVGDRVLAETERGSRVLERGGAPVYYFPLHDVRFDRLHPSPHASTCEWKGEASWYTYDDGVRRIENVAWSYDRPNPGYEAIAGHVAFYGGLVDEAWVGDERAIPQPGGFYGGWITSRIVGPVKGEPGA